MRIFDFETYQDYGWEGFFQVLTIPKKFALLDITIQWDEYSGTEIIPMISLRIGSDCLCEFTFRFRKFYFSCAIIDFSPRNLQWYRDNRND